MSLFDFKSDPVTRPGATLGKSIFSCDRDSFGAPENLVGSLRRAEMNLRGESASRFNQKGGRGRGALYDFIWIIYSVFFFIEPISDHSRRRWFEFVIVYAIFLAIYAGLVYARRRRTQYQLLGALAVLGLAYYPVNQGAVGMFIYILAFMPFMTESIGACIVVYASVTASLLLEGFLLHLSPWSYGFGAVFSLVIGFGNMVAAQRLRAGQRLGMAQEEIAHLAKVAERERIARDLHDVLGHTLSVVVLKSELAGKLMERDPERARHEIGEVEQIARKALADVREAITGYRSGGLAAEIARAKSTLDTAGVALECDAQPPQLPPAEETVLSLIVREAVTNIVRHAHASRCVLEIKCGGDGTALVVQDDGRGGIREEGNGLRGMRERAASIGASLRVESAHGTRLVIEIPLRAPAELPASAPPLADTVGQES